jgi:ankyrin repeat protein
LKMKKVLLSVFVWLLPVGLFAQQGDNNQQKTLVFTHVTVIDATGAPPISNMTVVIKGGRIAALGKTTNLDVPENAHVVDATGKFLIPGLWDMHIHPWSGKNFLALFTANGVTGVRVMWGAPEHHKWLKEISSGKLIGPRMVISSPIVDGPESIMPGQTVVSNEGEGRQVVRKVKKQGADLVKVGNYIPRDAYFAIADEAKKRGIPFGGHVPFSVSAAEASDAGQQSIEHCTFVLVACSSRSEEELKKKLKETLVTRPRSLPHVRARIKLSADIAYSEKKAAELFDRFVKNSTWVCPTLIVYNGALFRDEEDLANDPRLKYIPLSTRYWWKNDVRRVAAATGEGRADWRKLFEKHLAIVGAMRDAGVGLLAGTDTYTPGFGLEDELAVFVQAGLSPLEALQTATYNPAKCLGKLDSMGTVERGKVADLVLLDADPLQDIRNTQNIAAVVVGGKIFERAALQKMLAQVEAACLHQAAAEGNIEHVKFLISKGTDVNARDQQGWTPALAALYGGELAVTDLLLEKGADTTLPHLAAYTGDLRGIKSLLEKDTPVDSLEGLTLLHAAAAGGHTDVVEFLIAKGFEATATTEDDETTPLHLAALSGHKEVAELLIANGADVNSRERYSGRTPVELAMNGNHNEVAELLISKGADISPLHFALHMADPAKARSLIEGGADVNKRTPYGTTPLHKAVRRGFKDIVELLIENGADVNAKDNWDWTPLHSAVYDTKDMVELLIAKEADVNARDGAGRIPLWYAEKEGHTEIVELLRKHGAKE